MDGLILMLIAAICGTVLLVISSNYGQIPVEIYEETYSQKLAQNTLLSLYHITYLGEPESPFYRKSVMVAVSQDLAGGDVSLSNGGPMIERIIKKYSEQLGWEFMFTILDPNSIVDESMISTSSEVTDEASFDRNVGNPFCASAALTYPKSGGACSIEYGGSAGNMCYVIFEVCAWQP